MLKFNCTLLTLLLTATWLAGISKSANSSNSTNQEKIIFNSQFLATQFQQLSSEKSLFDEDIEPPRETKIAGSRAWENLFEDSEPPVDQSPGGSRGGDFCAIAPAVGTSTMTIWSDRPWFVWQGRVSRIEVRLHESEEVLWSQTFNTFDNSSVIYAGKPLQPGQTYDWEIFKTSSDSEIVTFKVMPEEDRNAIAAELTQMEAQLKRRGSTDEAIALQKANYFAKHKLWSDVLYSAYTVQNPSAALTQFKQKTISEKFCSSHSQSS